MNQDESCLHPTARDTDGGARVIEARTDRRGRLSTPGALNWWRMAQADMAAHKRSCEPERLALNEHLDSCKQCATGDFCAEGQRLHGEYERS